MHRHISLKPLCISNEEHCKLLFVFNDMLSIKDYPTYLYVNLTYLYVKTIVRNSTLV